MYKYGHLDAITNEYTCLIAGTIGSGKSVLLDDIIYNLAPTDCNICIIDLKRVQYNKWKGLPQLTRLAKNIEDALKLLDDISYTMECRYKEMEKIGVVKSEDTKIYLIIDELADLMTYPDVEEKLTHLMRLCRAANIAVIMATQSPSRKVITANIQNCTTSAMGLRCRSAIESRQIVGISGCENLPKYGEGIFWNADGHALYEIPYITEEKIRKQRDEAIATIELV